MSVGSIPAVDWSVLSQQALAWAPFLVSLAVFLVGLPQWRLAREKLRLDLYNRRFEVFSATFDFYQQLISWPYGDWADAAKIAEAGASDAAKVAAGRAAHLRFLKHLHEAPFLFAAKSGIRETISEIDAMAMKVVGFREHGHRLRLDVDLHYKSFEDANTLVLDTLPDLIHRLRDQLGVYLNFHGQPGSRG